MPDHAEERKEPIRSLFVEQKVRLEQALEFYRQLERAVPIEEHWKITKMSPLHDRLSGTIDKSAVLPPPAAR